VTLLLTTHYMDEAEQLCDRLVIMDGGHIVAEGSPRELIDRHAPREVVELRFATTDEQERAVPLLAPGAPRVESLTDRVLVYTSDGEAAVGMLAHHALAPLSVLVRRSSLEDVFLLLTGRALEE
jgi:lipooligosaccharide transport system ATP-binding protein